MKFFRSFGNSAGFTLIEVLASVVILSVGILGLATSINSVSQYQDQSKNTTLGTMYMTSKLEEIKRVATNEPTDGAFGFDYFVGTAATDFFTANAYVSTNDTTRTGTDPITPDGFTTTSVITIYPGNAPVAENFTNPGAIRLVDVLVTTSWVDKKGHAKSVNAGTVLHRRQFVN